MTLSNYINDLLYRYDCVIVPDFGGFITQKISAQIQEKTHVFYPPTKQLGFNHHLTHNDGLLANYVASCKNISFEKANDLIVEEVAKWNQTLKKKSITLDKIGVIALNENNTLSFSPNTDENYLADSFGLAAVSGNLISREEAKVVALQSTNHNKGIATFVKYAASAAIVLTLGYTGWNGYQNNVMKENFAKEQKKLENKIQSATFTINKPLPTIELSVAKEVAKPYHVIAGAFQIEENAHKKVKQLKSKGFDAYVLGKNKWGLTQVAYASFHKKSDAFKSLASVRKSDSKDAWLLVKKFY